jgi:uncharacterized protein YbjQ (UPF0145 family)
VGAVLGVFNSNLSVSEFVLAGQEEAVPIRQVMGNSVYKIGYQLGGARFPTGEIKGLMRPLRDVYLHAIFRMQQEAQQLGAHAVIGVRLAENRKHASLWTPKNVIQVKATGTAVALYGEDVPEKPALSGLSGQEFYMLRHTGYTPVGLVFGQSVYYQLTQWSSVSPTPPGVSALNWARVNLNTERVDYTQAVAKARYLAMKRLETEANYLGAEGVVGISVKTRRALLGNNLLVEFMALGTAIAAHGSLYCAAAHSVSLAG